MKNLTFNTQQNAIVRSTLSLEEFIIKYIAPSNMQNNNLKPIVVRNK